MKKAIFLLLFIIISCFRAESCSCLDLYFCTYIKDTTSKIAVIARVVKHKEYPPDNQAVYLKVIKKYKDELDITDTIKLYGRPQTAGCDVNVFGRFPVGATVMVALGYLHFDPWHGPIINPDSLHENLSEFKPSLCTIITLRIDNGIVSGRIDEGVYQYPYSQFETALQQCNFPPVPAEVCNYSVYPIPSVDGKVYVKREYLYDRIEKIRVLSMDGRLIREFSGQVNDIGEPIEIDLPEKGMQLLEISCSGKVYYKKVITM